MASFSLARRVSQQQDAVKSAPLEILMVDGPFPYYGHSFIESQVRTLVRLGHRVKVIAIEPGDHPASAVVPAGAPGSLSVRTYPWDSARRTKLIHVLPTLIRGLRDNPRVVMRLVRTLLSRYGLSGDFLERALSELPMAAERCDLIHFQWAHNAANWIDLVEIVDVPVVISCHGAEIQDFPLVDEKLRRRYPPLLARVDCAQCVSERVAQRVVAQGLDRDKAFVGYLGIDPSYFAPSEVRGSIAASSVSPAVRIVTVARMHWVKGYEYGLAAVRRLLDAGHRVTYTIVGGGDREGELAIRLAIRDLNLEDVVHLAGPRLQAEVRDILDRSDIFLMTSVSEGLSIAALEAMSMQLPVVVSDVGGMSEAVRHGLDGFVVPAREIVATAGALEQLVVDDRLRRDMGTSARQHVVDCFGVRECTEHLVERYRVLVAASSRHVSARVAASSPAAE